ncbi:MAG: TetR/AcrR family transcriptional regulator [Ilumatobacteraceae bacterium]
MNAATVSPRQPKQARAIRTRDRILDQAEQAFADKGFEAASLTSDILEPAGISVGSFYHQFPDKRAVLYALLDEREQWQYAGSDGTTPTTARTFAEAVRDELVEFFDDIDDHPATWWIRFRELNSADAEIRTLIEQSWQGWQDSVASMLAQWVDDPAVNTAGRASYAVAGLRGVLREYLAAEPAARRKIRTDSLDDVVAACVGSFVS